MTALLSERLDAALLAASRTGSRLASITLPAPAVHPSHVFAACLEPTAYYLGTGDRSGDVGFGAAVNLQSNRIEDLAAFEAESLELLEHVFTVGINAAAHLPRLYGGVSYDQAPNSRGPWRNFLRIHFQLPRFRYRTDGDRATLTVCLLRDELSRTSELPNWRDQTLNLISGLPLSLPQQRAAYVKHRTEIPTPEVFLKQVEHAKRAISRGTLEKVVLAREVCLELDQHPDLGQLLESVDRLSPETTRFAFRRGTSIFFGATPERLVSRVGSEVRTEAVAGSVRAQDSDAATLLMQSEKEMHEHELVVRELVRKLEQLGARPTMPSRPSIRQLRHVFHLATSITTRLFGAPHVLSLVRHLHPTPAVGGVPQEVAAEFTREHEGFERGWYAAPIGWFDGAGDGEFFVGLRSGLLEDRVLRLYAGAGIVRDSQPESEYRETELKLQTLLEAFGSLNGSQAIRKGEAVGVG